MVVVAPPSVMVRISVVVENERLVMSSSVVEAVATLLVDRAVIRPSSSIVKVTSSVVEPKVPVATPVAMSSSAPTESVASEVEARRPVKSTVSVPLLSVMERISVAVA